MKKKIQDALATKFEGVSASVLDRIATKLAKTIKNEDEIASAVEDVTLQQIIDGYADARANEATKTAIKNYESKHKLKDGVKVEDEPETKVEPDDDTPAWGKALLTAIKSQADRIEAIERGKVTENRRSQLNKVLEKLPETLRKGYARVAIDGQSDEDFEKLIGEISTEVDEIEQSTRAKGAIVGRPLAANKQAGNKSTAEATDEELKAVVESLHIK